MRTYVKHDVARQGLPFRCHLSDEPDPVIGATGQRAAALGRQSHVDRRRRVSCRVASFRSHRKSLSVWFCPFVSGRFRDEQLLHYYVCVLQPEYYRDNSDFSCVSNGNRHQLRILHAKLTHTGTYTLLAANPHGQAKALISLQVYSAGKCTRKTTLWLRT